MWGDLEAVAMASVHVEAAAPLTPDLIWASTLVLPPPLLERWPSECQQREAHEDVRVPGPPREALPRTMQGGAQHGKKP